MLLSDKSSEEDPKLLAELQSLGEKLRRHAPEESAAVRVMRRDARIQLDALAGQLRSAFELASRTTQCSERRRDFVRL